MATPTTIDEYLSALPSDQRRALQTLRAQIKAAAPGAEEYIGYGLAGFKFEGRPLVYIGAAKNHCAIYGARADDALADKLKGYKQSKGTIQFTPDKPIPAALVKEILSAPEHSWMDGLPKEELKQLREHYSGYYDKKLPGSD